MIFWRLIIILVGVVLVSCGGGQDDDDVSETPEFVRARGFEIVNQQRVHCGFPAMAQGAQLDSAAEAHANYLRINEDAGHSEVVGKPGFTGVSSGDRARRAGFSSNYVGENISYSRKGVEAAVRGLFSAPYHGLNFLRPSYEQMGSSVARPHVFNLGMVRWKSPKPTRLLHYPCEGTAGVLAHNTVGENPDPFPQEPNATWGQPVYVLGREVVRISSVQILAGSEIVPIKVIYGDGNLRDPNGWCSDNQACIIPGPLRKNATYSVVVSGSDGARPFDLRFNFSTGNVDE